MGALVHVTRGLCQVCSLNSVTNVPAPVLLLVELITFPLSPVWCQLSKLSIQPAFSEPVFASQPCSIIYSVTCRISLCICGCWKKEMLFTLVAGNKTSVQIVREKFHSWPKEQNCPKCTTKR